jgi:hypothetical protein
MTNCDGSQAIIVTNNYCNIPSLSLHLSPFLLPWASHVYAKVVATNIYGDSQESLPGNGAIVYAVPDKPTDLTEDYAQRTANSLGLIWIDGADPGGLPVLDYRVRITEPTTELN